MNRLFDTTATAWLRPREASPWILTTLRVTVGAVMAMHGLQKLGWFGGPGYENLMAFFTQTLHLPAAVGWFALLTETAGALLLLAGALTRPAAVAVIAVMLGAVVTVHAPVGFFMDWSGTKVGEGYEYHLLVIAMAAMLALFGPGAWSIDALLARKRHPRGVPLQQLSTSSST